MSPGPLPRSVCGPGYEANVYVPKCTQESIVQGGEVFSFVGCHSLIPGGGNTYLVLIGFMYW